MTDDLLGKQVLRALSTVLLSLRAEDADLHFVRLEHGVAQLRLVLGTKTCGDCIMPKGYLENVMLTILRERFPRIEQVRLDDPREPHHPSVEERPC